MFFGDSKLLSIDLSSFDSSNVLSMFIMFQGCSSLNVLDLSNFDTSHVTYMDGIFAKCSNLTYLDISGFSNQSIKDEINYIFSEGTQNGTILYNSDLFNPKLIDIYFEYWEKIDVSSDLNLQKDIF